MQSIANTAEPSAASTASPHASSKPKDTKAKREKLIPWSQRPRLTGSTIVQVPHLYDASLPTVAYPISNDDLQFDLKPGYLGRHDGDFFVYLNPQDQAWLLQELPNPRMVIYVLCKRGLVLDVAYAKRRLLEEAIRSNIQIYNINPRKFDLSYGTAQDPQSITHFIYDGKPIPRPHCMLTRAGANIDYWGKCVCRHIEQCGIKVFNNMEALEISRDKFYTHQLLAPKGIALPLSILCKYPFDVSLVESQLTYPLIVKMTSGSLGEQVWKADSRSELVDILNSVDQSKPLIFQEFIANSSGRDLRIFIVGNRVCAAMLRSATNSFKANIAQGGNAHVIRVSDELANWAVQVKNICKLDMAGIDVLMDKDCYKICEVNASPLFEGLEKATGVNVAKEMIDMCIEWFENSQKQNQIVNDTKLVA